MAFCNKCGAQSQGNERFCVKCGNDLMATAAPAPMAAPPMAPAPMPYVAPGQVPLSVAIPPQAPAKKSGMMWVVIIVAIVGGYYYYEHYYQPSHPTPGGTPPATQPGPGPGAPPATPGTAPEPAAPVQPGEPGPGGPNEAVVQQQAFTGSWRLANGMVELYNQQWQNRSNVTLQSATLECDQYDQNGTVLSQQRIALSKSDNTAVQPGETVTFNPFNVGQAVQGLKTVNCGIVAVTPAQ